jgi:hypothetical protein
MIVELASPVPDTDDILLSSHFRSLSQEDQEDIANDAWIILHMRDGPQAFNRPLEARTLDVFKLKVDEIATARAIGSSARLRSHAAPPATPSVRPPHPAPPSPLPPPSAAPPSNVIDYSLLVPVTTASHCVQKSRNTSYSALVMSHFLLSLMPLSAISQLTPVPSSSNISQPALCKAH